MTHEELRDRLLDLAYGELSPREAREVEEHAATCETCRAELGRIRGTRQLMAALPEEPAPERGAPILVAAAREAVRGRAPRRRWLRWTWAAPVAAAALAAVVTISLRLGSVRPPALREDPNAILGQSSFARAPEAPPQDAAEAKGAGGEAAPRPGDGAGAAAAAAPDAARADRADRVEGEARVAAAPRAEKKAAAPRAREEAERRFATAPPPAEPDRNAAAERLAAAPAPAAPPAAAPRAAAPAPVPAPVPFSDLAAPEAGAAGAAQAPSASAGAPTGAKSAAAPARRAQAKAMVAPEATRDADAPCAGIDRSLTAERRRSLAAAIGPQLGSGAVVVLATFRSGAWSIVHVGTPERDEPFLFFDADPGAARFVTAWSGAAQPSERGELETWALENARGVPPALARCFAWHVAIERGARP
jgi:hypothetical protein